MIGWTETQALDEASMSVFGIKGQGSPRFPGQVDRELLNGNAVKVRRVIQLTQDIARKPAHELRLLDLACGDGVYSIEIGLRGAQVLAVDGRNDRMQHGAACAQTNGLTNVRFEQIDVRHLTRASHGTFDIIYNLGILYHLDVPDLFTWLENLYDMCDHAMIIDTHIARLGLNQATHKGRTYRGMKSEEHKETDTQEQKQGRTYLSLDNPYNFVFTRDSLMQLLADVGFTSVSEVGVPFEPYKHADRVTFLACKGQPVKLSTYPAINGMTEAEIASDLTPKNAPAAPKPKQKSLLKRVARKVFNTVGLEVRRVGSK